MLKLGVPTRSYWSMESNTLSFGFVGEILLARRRADNLIVETRLDGPTEARWLWPPISLVMYPLYLKPSPLRRVPKPYNTGAARQRRPREPYAASSNIRCADFRVVVDGM